MARFCALLTATTLDADGYQIQWRDVADDQRATQQELEKAMLVEPPSFEDKAPPVWHMHQLDAANNTWCVPRHWAEANIGSARQTNFGAIDERPQMGASFIGVPREHQKRACEWLRDQLKHGMNTPLLSRVNLYTGWGKTFFAMFAGHLLRTRMLIISHKNVLLEQYAGEVEKFFEPNSIKIGVLNGGRKKCDPDDESLDIVLATVQSIVKRPRALRNFGLVIIDEVHHYGSRTFSTVAYKANAPIMIGLTADKERSDGLDYVIDAHFGPVQLEEDPQVLVGCAVDVHVFQCVIVPRVKEKAYKDEVGWMEKMNALCASEERNMMISNAVRYFYAQDDHALDRHMLMLCKNKEQVDFIHADLLKTPPTGTVAEDVVQWTGDRKNRKMDHALALKAKIIVATYGMLGEGVSLDILDTLVICSQNKMNMNQAFGRILRQRFDHPYTVLDFDDTQFFPGMFRHRLKQYKERMPGSHFQVHRWHTEPGDVRSTFIRSNPSTAPNNAVPQHHNLTVVPQKRKLFSLARST